MSIATGFRTRFVPFAAWLASAFAPPAGAAEEANRPDRARLREAFDPRSDVKPPLMRTLAGESAPLVEDADFLERAARFRAARPVAQQARGEALRVGEVLVLQGDDQTTMTDGMGNYSVRLAGLAARAIAELGDDFHFITVWMTFSDAATPAAAAYERTLRNDVAGIGIGISNTTPSSSYLAYGSKGTLKSMLNMKRYGQRTADTRAAWADPIEVWGQESAHRWLVFLRFLDRRTGRPSDALLGRQCAHYQRFVDTQGSIQDGVWWRDNRDGSFTIQDTTERYGPLDLYAMGLLAPEDVAPFFLIEEIADYKHPGCGDPYTMASPQRPTARTVQGKRLDLTIDDIIAVHGSRRPHSDESQNYWREANVVVTLPTETPSSTAAMQVAQRVDRARVWWEEWNQGASRNRHVICTQTTKDCGDPRSDVARFDWKPNAGRFVLPNAPLPVEVEVRNGGGRVATGVRLTVEALAGDILVPETRTIGTLATGATSVQTIAFPLASFACGTEVELKAYTQSDFHYHRRLGRLLVGAEVRASDGFEAASGFVVNPDRDDTSTRAVWERGRVSRTLVANTPVQPESAREGNSVFGTGLATSGSTTLDVRGGKTTLESPEYDARGLRDPVLRYSVSFVSVRQPNPPTPALEPNPDGRLIVLARAGGGELVEIDRIEGSADTMLARWTRRAVKLPSTLKLDGTLRFRFVAEERHPMGGVVEAFLDDLQLTSNLPECAGLPPPAPPPKLDGGPIGAGSTDGGAGRDAASPDAAPDATEGADAPAKGASGGCGCRIGEARKRASRETGVASAAALLGLGILLARRRSRAHRY